MVNGYFLNILDGLLATQSRIWLAPGKVGALIEENRVHSNVITGPSCTSILDV